jgi:putative NADH-flavin reductase
MNLAIVAATGGIGSELLRQAAAAKHIVTAIVRDPTRLSEQVRAFTVDLAKPQIPTLRSAIEGANAVLSGLGAHSRLDVGVAWLGTQAIVTAMTMAGVKRLIVVSAAPIGTVPSPHRPSPPKFDPGDGFFMRHVMAPLTKAVLREHYADLAHMEDVLRSSTTEWTIVRPPRLTNGPRTTRYRIAHGQNLRGGLSVSRADVAHFMLGAVNDPRTVRTTIGIAD